MSAQGLEIIDDAVRPTHERLDWPGSRNAMRLVRTVLVESRDRSPRAEVADPAAQMPLPVRGMSSVGWHPARMPVADRSAEGFETAVAARLGRVHLYRGRADIAAIFAMLAHRLSEGERRQTRRALPRAVRDLWPPETVRDGDRSHSARAIASSLSRSAMSRRVVPSLAMMPSAHIRVRVRLTVSIVRQR